VNSELVQLIHLQALDLEIQGLTRQRDTFPQQIKSLEQEIKKAESSVQDSHAEMDRLRKERRRLEGEVDSLRARLSKYKDQLMAVKTNKEYTAMLHEIEGCNKEITSKEDEILAIMEKVENQEKSITVGQKDFAARREQVQKHQSDLKKQMDAADAQIKSLMADRSRMLGNISASLISMYDRIARARKGIALAEARDQSCQVCHVRLRPQMFNEIKKNQQIITCESCNRILYYPATAS
jgi:hypothetical protein